MGHAKTADSTSLEEPGADDSVLGPPSEWGGRRVLEISLRLLGRAGLRAVALGLLGLAFLLTVAGLRVLAPEAPRPLSMVAAATLGSLWCWLAQALLGSLLLGEETDLVGAAAALWAQLPRLAGLVSVVTAAGVLAWGLFCLLLAGLEALGIHGLLEKLLVAGAAGLLLDLLIRASAFASLEILVEGRDPVASMLRSLELAPSFGEGLAFWVLAVLGTWGLVVAVVLPSTVVAPSTRSVLLPVLTSLAYLGAMVLGQAIWVTTHQGRVRGRASPGLMTPLEWMICGGIVVTLCAIAEPNLSGRDRVAYSQFRGCQAAQKTVEGALEIFELDTGRTVTALDPGVWEQLVSQGYLQVLPHHRMDPPEVPSPLRRLPAGSFPSGGPRMYCLDHGFAGPRGGRGRVASAYHQLVARGVQDPARLEEASRLSPISPVARRPRQAPWSGLPLWLPAALLATPPPWGLGVALGHF